jgi:DNA (cytosine-5)-methyltransferase 1
VSAFHNDADAHCAQWLRNLTAAGHIASGVVDARDVRDLQAKDLDGHAQCHFFAGIGGWSLALRLAGWPDDRPVWTGSCPCQPFSQAGSGKGHEDERHLWPAWARLIRQCRPRVVFGEQVASHDGLAWLDVVCAELEDIGYAVAAVDLPAAGIGAPHIRQRLWFVADSALSGRGQLGWGGRAGAEDPWPHAHEHHHGHPTLGYTSGERPPARESVAVPGPWRWAEGRATVQSGAARGPWADAEWLACRDGKARPTEPGLFPLAHGIPGRVGRLRAYRNAIVPQAAAAVIRAYMDIQP